MGIPSALIVIAQWLYFLSDHATGTYQDATGRVKVCLRLFKATITRDGVVTEYGRRTAGDRIILTRGGVQVVLVQQEHGSLTDAAGNRLKRVGA